MTDGMEVFLFAPFLLLISLRNPKILLPLQGHRDRIAAFTETAPGIRKPRAGVDSEAALVGPVAPMMEGL